MLAVHKRVQTRRRLQGEADGVGWPRRPLGLAVMWRTGYVLCMSRREIAEAVMDLPEAERLELARQIVASVVAERENAEEVERAVKGIEDVLTGKVRGL